ncbi:class II histocompatibility antigen, M beta 1 chain [Hyperolius riggenbachi]|uniref:class II histocompatibility antigen, M beta 1 chain n=1 Tax=Hyperolius riggenbachi TaxID=752182 RepID=UPI0035A3B388
MRGAVAVLVLICGVLYRSVTGYVMQEMTVCTYSDDKEGNNSFIYGFNFNRQFVLLYDESAGMFIPTRSIEQVLDVVRIFSARLNMDPQMPDRVKKEKERCKQNIGTFWEKTVERRAEPSVEVFLPVVVHSEGLPVLICHVSGFYPPDIGVAWFKNDVFVKNHSEAVQVGDWTYQLVATMDMRNSLPSDNYTCMVYHSTLTTPIAKNWRPGLTQIQIIKISVATVVFVLGLVVLILGYMYWKNFRSGYSLIPEYRDIN